MIELKCRVVGAESVAANLEGMSARIHNRIRSAVEAAGIDLQKGVKRGRLTGQSLKVRSTRLRGSITQQLTDDGESIKSRVGTNVVYGRFWELGYHGAENVDGHYRRIFRRTKSGRRGKMLNAAWVSPHKRRVDQDPRPFLGPELEAKRASIRRRIEKAVFGNR
jgi:phage gpG-like protein